MKIRLIFATLLALALLSVAATPIKYAAPNESDCWQRATLLAKCDGRAAQTFFDCMQLVR